MPINGLTKAQSDFVEAFILVPKRLGKKKAEKRRDTAIKEFRRFNVNRDAVATRIAEIPGDVERKLLMGELSKAEALVGDNPKALDFDAALERLVAVNEAVTHHKRQAEVKQKHALAVMRMDLVENGPQLDNIEDIELVWTYAENTFQHAIKSNNQSALAEADKSFEQLFDLIQAGREDIRGEGREAKRKLREVEIALQELDETLNTAFTIAHVPPPITGRLAAVKAQLDAGEKAAVDALSGIAAAAEAALKTAETEGHAIIADRKRWEEEHDGFRLRYDVMDAHPLASDRDFVAPKFKEVTDAYEAAANRALKHEYVGAVTDLTPLFARVDAALKFADDYQNFLATLEKRRSAVDALPDAASRTYDQVKDAITAARTLLTDALALRDAADMDGAIKKLEKIRRDVPEVEQLIKYEDWFNKSHPALDSWTDDYEDTPDIARLMAPDIALIKKTVTDAEALANTGNIGDAVAMVTNFWGYKSGMDAKKELIEEFLKEKVDFLQRLAETKAFKGRVAVESYYQQLKEDKVRMDTWEGKLDVPMALQAATALKDRHEDMKKRAELGETYVEIKDKLDPEILRLEGGAPGADQAVAAVALARQLMNDALAMSQKDDWFQAVRLMHAATAALSTATKVAKNAKIIDDMVDSPTLDNLGADFDTALGEFQKVYNAVSDLDDMDPFKSRLDGAKTKAEGARNLVATDLGQARAQLGEAIADCRTILTDWCERSAYENRAETVKGLLKELNKDNKDKCVQPEIDAAQQFLDNAKTQAEAATPDYRAARTQLANAERQIREGFGVTPFYKSHKSDIDYYEKLLKKLRDGKNAAALNTEAKRFGDLVDAIKDDFTNRRIEQSIKKRKEADQLFFAYRKQIENYEAAAKRYKSGITNNMGDEMTNAGTTALAAEIRTLVTEIDKAMADHLYDTAFFMIRNAEFKIATCKRQAKDHDALLPVKTAAADALRELRDRDEPENGPGHDKLVELQAIFDTASEKETLLNYSGAAKTLAGFVKKCTAAAPLFDKFDLYVAARGPALAAVDDINRKGTAGIAPLFKRIEGRRDNALKLAAAFDFDAAIGLFQELLGDCTTARNALESQVAFGAVMDMLKDVDGGDEDELRMSISAARATFKQIASKPMALFVKAALDAASGKIDAAEAQVDDDFDKARDQLKEALDDCNTLVGEMGRFEQFTDTVELARKMLNNLLNTHPQAAFTRDEVTALLKRVNDGMAAVRSDPAQRTRVRDDVEAVIADCHDLRKLLDTHHAWHLEHRQVAQDFGALEKNKDRNLIVAEMTEIRNCLDTSTARANARDHTEAMKQLAKARDHIAQAHLQIKVRHNEAPSKDELKRLLDAPDGYKLLDDIINRLDPDVQRKVMNSAFEARFGCKLDLFASPKKEKKGKRDKDLGKKAPNIKRFYEVMSALPPSSTLDNDSMLIVSHAGEKADGSYYRSDIKEVAMREGEVGNSGLYGVGLEQELGKTRDQLHLEEGKPMSFFSWNTLHEVGHAVDDKLGFMNRNGQRLAGWRVFGANVRPVADAIAADVKFDSNYIAEYISGGAGSEPPIPEPVGCEPEEWERRRREACVWVDRVRHKKKPWSSDSIAKDATASDGKVYHESYANDWACYDYSARASGVSGYQFRAPGEWFSELYAAVHSKKLKNSHPHYAEIAGAK